MCHRLLEAREQYQEISNIGFLHAWQEVGRRRSALGVARLEPGLRAWLVRQARDWRLGRLTREQVRRGGPTCRHMPPCKPCCCSSCSPCAVTQGFPGKVTCAVNQGNMRSDPVQVPVREFPPGSL